MAIKQLTEPVYEMDYCDLDEICREEFGLTADWSCIVCWECQNDSAKIIQIPLQYKDAEDIKAVKADAEIYGSPARTDYGAPVNMMQIMYERGKLQSGTYIVRVSW